MQQFNVDEKFARIAEYWRPNVVPDLNGQEVKLVNCRGTFVWHRHDN